MVELTPEEIDAMVGVASASGQPPDADDLSLLAALGEPVPELAETTGNGERSTQLAAAAAPGRPPSPRDPSEPSWLQVLDQIPQYEKLIRHYPSVAPTRLEDGRQVIVAVYLHDTRRGIVRNYMVDGQRFLDLEAVKTLEFGGREHDYRVVVKVLEHNKGMTIRCWEHHTGVGDIPSSKVKIVVGDNRFTLKKSTS